jgi:uncharacterized damage-inducible protein DinB
MQADALANDFAAYACEKLQRNLAQIGRCARLLTREQTWLRANENCNAVGNLIVHLTGNVSQWIAGGIEGREVQRNRDAEFARREPLATDEILARLETVVDDAMAIIRGCGPQELAEPRRIQGYDVTVLAAIFHVVEHFSWHTGQIVHMAKALLDVDVSMYDAEGRPLAGSGGSAP